MVNNASTYSIGSHRQVAQTKQRKVNDIKLINWGKSEFNCLIFTFFLFIDLINIKWFSLVESLEIKIDAKPEAQLEWDVMVITNTDRWNIYHDQRCNSTVGGWHWQNLKNIHITNVMSHFLSITHISLLINSQKSQGIVPKKKGT